MLHRKINRNWRNNLWTRTCWWEKHRTGSGAGTVKVWSRGVRADGGSWNFKNGRRGMKKEKDGKGSRHKFFPEQKDLR